MRGKQWVKQEVREESTHMYPAVERHNINALLMGHSKHLKGLL